MHPPPGRITAGSCDVWIGGPTVGVTLGDPDAGNSACVAAASGREGNAQGQTAQNCGVESARQIINQATNSGISEKDLLEDAMDHGNATREATLEESGGTGPDGRQAILDRHGVESTLEDATAADLQQALAEGKGVITSHDAGKLWNKPTYLGSGHAILVTGAEYDANGELKTVYFNDTGTGECRNSLPAADFLGSLRSGRDMNVTKDPIW